MRCDHRKEKQSQDDLRGVLAFARVLQGPILKHALPPFPLLLKNSKTLVIKYPALKFFIKKGSLVVFKANGNNIRTYIYKQVQISLQSGYM